MQGKYINKARKAVVQCLPAPDQRGIHFGTLRHIITIQK